MKTHRNRLAVILVVLSVAFFGIIVFTFTSGTDISGGLGTVITPLQKIVYKVNSRVKETVDFFLNFSEVKSENEQLKEENAELESQLIEYETLKSEVEELEDMLNYTEENDNYNYVGANVISTAGSSYSSGYIIDKGSNDGITEGMAVVTSSGLVAKVTKVSDNYSVIQTVLSENISVAVYDQTTGDTGILQGTSDSEDNGLVQIINISASANVQAGDVILTSGLGGIYPTNLIVGVVTEVEYDSNTVMKTAYVQTYADCTDLDTVWVVVPKNEIDEDALGIYD